MALGWIIILAACRKALARDLCCSRTVRFLDMCDLVLILHPHFGLQDGMTYKWEKDIIGHSRRQMGMINKPQLPMKHI